MMRKLEEQFQELLDETLFALPVLSLLWWWCLSQYELLEQTLEDSGVLGHNCRHMQLVDRNTLKFNVFMECNKSRAVS